jgi:phosphopantothenoylcysteine decarboxylase/phosphopantothenate--cysteine ligase
MHCLVTAGPTYESLDNVRRLTNFSTGRLGCELAHFLMTQGHVVTLLIGEQATYCGARGATQIEGFSTTTDLRDRLHALSKRPVDALFHAAAVSDFTFGKTWLRSAEGELTEIKSGKISTRNGTLLTELLPTKKIISELRAWFPQTLIVGWKYEVDGDRLTVLKAARKQIQECRTDACVANGPAYGKGFGLVKSGGEMEELADAQELFASLERLMRSTS